MLLPLLLCLCLETSRAQGCGQLPGGTCRMGYCTNLQTLVRRVSMRMILRLIVCLTLVHWCSHTAAATPNTLDGITIELHKAEFQHLDTNQDGHLDDDEIMAMMAIDNPEEQQINQEEDGNGKDDDISDLDVIAFIVELDQNQDGLVSWKEYENTLLNDHAPTLEEFLPEQFEDIDGFVEAANDFVNERNGE